MSTTATITTTTTTTTAEPPKAQGYGQGQNRMLLDGKPTNYGDFRDALNRDGYAVIKGAIPLDRANGYADAFYSYMEGFNLGYNRHDPSTVRRAKLPVLNEKGMILDYGVTHEQWVWDIRGEEGVVDAFKKVYDDEDLIVSFDVVNVGFANREDLPENKPWPHQDQDPSKPGFRCLQGLVNLLPNGPNDGGLIVCKGGHALSAQFHTEMAHEERIPAWTTEWFGFTDAGMKWLADHGLKWEKVCAEPGDLIVWDSRTPHYNVPPTGGQDRFAVYTCFMPVREVEKEDLVRKRGAFESRLGTTHWPHAKHVSKTNIAMRDGKPCPVARERPVQEPVLSERVFKLTGIPYLERMEGGAEVAA
ncbi:phytanoyl-CoA dioxygenase [Aspergillus vadensis CBS 113365]|uniref:Phytanoyl-CoA dioxygenase n=1 Tax=Aspergillus vadensis (strain CBS 113365 / IMI 142717 / IBT 24658) TaxID=1448311 RepID=A0A319BPP5_ASPVC|nr:phytanoyl-CoA dioxygenase [Aspergillus vadensis CBS 113365]PYH67673.1 phytanoyl-CoA dioxygenase [Aspergillus vadensis CBS 113365]